MTTAAAKAIATADALLAWLRDQPPPVSCARHGLQPAPGAAQPGATTTPLGADSAGHQADPAGAGEVIAGLSATPVPAPPAPVGNRLDTRLHTATAPDTGTEKTGGAPLRLAHTDWLYHRLSITGPPAALAAFQTAAAGAGVIPWHLDLDRIADDCFYRLVAPPPPPPQQRSLSLAGARIVVGQLRDAVARRHELAVARVGRSRACRFDLHALVPVPGEILRRGPDDPMSLAWLWQHWGTTQGLRHVAAAPETGQDRAAAGETMFAISFWSADWSPWRALAEIAVRWPALRFDLRPSYDAP